MMVILRSLSFSSVREAMIAGTEQPNPISSGMKDLPERPKRLNARSIMNAALAIYPLSSSRERKKNKIAICGRKTRTPPTPGIMPSETREKSHSGVLRETRAKPLFCDKAVYQTVDGIGQERTTGPKII